MYVMPDMNMPDAESLIMQIQFGRSFSRDSLGIEPRACWIADCWGHHAQLPQILRKCGYESYFFWRCMREDVLKNDFLWRGIDGTTIQTHWLARGYANLRFPTDATAVNAAELSFAERERQHVGRAVLSPVGAVQAAQVGFAAEQAELAFQAIDHFLNGLFGALKPVGLKVFCQH